MFIVCTEANRACAKEYYANNTNNFYAGKCRTKLFNSMFFSFFLSFLCCSFLYTFNFNYFYFLSPPFFIWFFVYYYIYFFIVCFLRCYRMLWVLDRIVICFSCWSHSVIIYFKVNIVCSLFLSLSLLCENVFVCVLMQFSSEIGDITSR